MHNPSFYQKISEEKIERGRYILIAYRKELAKIRHCQIKTCKKRFDFGKHRRTIDHIIPLWNGGTNDRKNLQAICWSCHQEKNKQEEKLKISQNAMANI